MRDPKVEAWLNKLLVEWNYVEAVNIADIRFNSDSRNSKQVRFDLLDSQNYQAILKSRLNGDEMPALLLNKADDGFYILDGNHRLESAIEAEMKTHDAYVVAVESDSALELQLMLEPNTRLAAKPLTEEERLRWSIYLVDNSNYTQKQIAEMVGISPAAVSNAIRQHQAFVRASRVLIKDKQLFNSWDKLNSGYHLKLDKVTSDIGWRSAVEATTTYKLNNQQVTELVNRLKPLRSDDKQVKAVDEFISELKAGNTVKRNSSEKRAWESVKMHAGAIKNVDPKRIERELSSGTLDERQLKEFQRYLEEAQAVINSAIKTVSTTSHMLANAPRKSARKASRARR